MKKRGKGRKMRDIDEESDFEASQEERKEGEK